MRRAADASARSVLVRLLREWCCRTLTTASTSATCISLQGRDGLVTRAQSQTAPSHATRFSRKEVRDLTLPGFTAQASLEETSRRYRILATAEKPSNAQVVPAAPCCEGCESSYYCMQCFETGAQEYCRWCYNCLRWCVPCGIWS
jgi:hypothetical protein